MKQRKNKTNQFIVWPSTMFFTIEQLWDANPEFVLITLRVRLGKEIEAGQVVELGTLQGGQGRPKKVFSKCPITQTVIDKAESSNITLVENAKKLIFSYQTSSDKSNVLIK